MSENQELSFVTKEADGTSKYTFFATDIVEQWGSAETEQSTEIFTKEDFEEKLKTVSRKINK